MKKWNKKPKTIACRCCGLPSLSPVLSLGALAVSSFTKHPEEGNKYPLTLAICDPENGGCGLVQLLHKGLPASILYHTYWYRSGINTSMQRALFDIASQAKERVPLHASDIILDIGANDGTLLSYFPKDTNRIAFEPAKNLINTLQKNCNTACNACFSKQQFLSASKEKKAKIITAIAMFYDLDNPNTFISDVRECLDAHGLFIIQMADLLSMLTKTMFDNICHEHVAYYSLTTLQKLLTKHGLTIVDIAHNNVNGGSIRVYITHSASAKNFHTKHAQRRITAYLKKELKTKCNTKGAFLSFADSVQTYKNTLRAFIQKESKKGKMFAGYGASTKGNTLLQYYQLTTQEIPYIADRNPTKENTFTIRTKIPIISEKEARKKKPDYFLVLPWHFKTECIRREKEFLATGGTLIFPLPTPTRVFLQGTTTISTPL